MPYAVVLPRAEVVVLGPLERPAAQPLEIHLELAHRRGDFRRGWRPAGVLERRLEHHADDIAFGEIGRRILDVATVRDRPDLGLDGQVVLEEGVRADDVEVRILDARELLLGIEVRPSQVAALPAEPPHRLVGAHLREPGRPGPHPVRIGVLELGGEGRVVRRWRRRDLLVHRRHAELLREALGIVDLGARYRNRHSSET